MKKTPAVLVDEVKTEESNIQQFEKLKLSMIKRLVLSKTLLQQCIKLIDHWIPNGAKKEKRYSNVRLLNIIKI